MIAVPLGATRAEEIGRVVVALGRHRYVAGRMHLVHALALAAIPDDAEGRLADGRTWALGVLGRDDVDPASRDERLWRRCDEMEVAAVVDAFWLPGERRHRAHAALREGLARLELEVPAHPPFDETLEDAQHPLLVDAGWELLPLAELDPARHAGAIGAFGDMLAFESARFEEESAIPPVTPLFELPALGAVELLGGTDDDGTLVAPLVVWAEGHETYVDYVVRGVRRAAKLPERIELDDASP